MWKRRSSVANRRWSRRLELEVLEQRLTPTGAVRSIASFDAPGDDDTYSVQMLTRGDDNSTSTTLGFTLNFFGNRHTNVFVNNNGNLTFGSGLSSFTPFNLTSTNSQIIAPFFADVDTRGVIATSPTDLVKYGKGTVDGHKAFFVNWIGVGYYSQSRDKVNTFQVVLIDRPDTGTGERGDNFDIEFNYDQVRWETGSASNGTAGLGGDSVRVGFSNGTGNPGTFFELAGSAIDGAFLDSNQQTGLIHNALDSGTLGRYRFKARGSKLTPLEGTIREINSESLRPGVTTVVRAAGARPEDVFSLGVHQGAGAGNGSATLASYNDPALIANAPGQVVAAIDIQLVGGTTTTSTVSLTLPESYGNQSYDLYRRVSDNSYQFVVRSFFEEVDGIQRSVLSLPSGLDLTGTVFTISVANTVAQTGTVPATTVSATVDSSSSLSQAATFVSQTQLTVGVTASQVRQIGPAGVTQGSSQGGSFTLASPTARSTSASAEEAPASGRASASSEVPWWALFPAEGDPFAPEAEGKGKPDEGGQPMAPMPPKDGGKMKEEGAPSPEEEETAETSQFLGEGLLDHDQQSLSPASIDSLFSNPLPMLAAALPALMLFREMPRRRRVRRCQLV